MESTLDEAYSKYPDDEKMIEYFKRFHDLFKKKGVVGEKSCGQLPVDEGGSSGSGNLGGEDPSNKGGDSGSWNLDGEGGCNECGDIKNSCKENPDPKKKE